MNLFIESLKALLFGIVEGITEWLPISSTGHMILLDEFIQLQMSDAFKSMFEVVIQLGAILAVVVLYFPELWPFKKPEKGEGFVGLLKNWRPSVLWVTGRRGDSAQRDRWHSVRRPGWTRTCITRPSSPPCW